MAWYEVSVYAVSTILVEVTEEEADGQDSADYAEEIAIDEAGFAGFVEEVNTVEIPDHELESAKRHADKVLE